MSATPKWCDPVRDDGSRELRVGGDAPFSNWLDQMSNLSEFTLDHLGGEPVPAGSTGLVVAYLRGFTDRRGLRPGDRLPGERDLAALVGVSRSTVRAGLRALAAMGVVQSRHGSGTYIPQRLPHLGREALSPLAALHRPSRGEMYEARGILEVEAAGLAAARATADQTATLAEEVASLFASLDDPVRFLDHDVAFHRAVAAASGNPVVASLVGMVASLYHDRRRVTAAQASDRDLRDAAGRHRRIYRAIRAHDPVAARAAMRDHLVRAGASQAQGPAGAPAS